MTINTAGATRSAPITTLPDSTGPRVASSAARSTGEYPGQGGLQGSSISVGTGHEREAALANAAALTDHLGHSLDEEVGESDDEFFDAKSDDELFEAESDDELFEAESNPDVPDAVQEQASVAADSGEQSIAPHTSGLGSVVSGIGSAVSSIGSTVTGIGSAVMDGLDWGCQKAKDVISSAAEATSDAVSHTSAVTRKIVDTLPDLPHIDLGAVFTPVEAKSRSETNIEKIEQHVEYINDELDKLNESIHAIAGVHIRPPEDSQISHAQPSTWENIAGKGTYVLAAGKALFDTAHTLTGTVAAAGAGAAVGSVLPIPGVSVASVAGGAYAVINTLKNFPELLKDERVLITIQSKQAAMEPKLRGLSALMKEERLRQDASHRHASIAMGRVERIKDLTASIEQIENVIALRTASGGVNDTELDGSSPSSKQGNGSASAAILDKSKQSLAAFERFLAPLVNSIKSIRSTVFPTQSQRTEKANRQLARAAEDQFNASNTRMLSKLAMPNNSTLKGGADVRAAAALKAGGGPVMAQRDLLRSMTIGENLTRAIVNDEGSNLGVAHFTSATGNADFAVQSNLTTARHVVRYLFAQAEGSNRPDGGDSDRMVSLRGNGVLELQHGARSVYEFLVNAEGALSLDGGGMMIKDHGRNMPQGADAVTFDMQVRDGKSVLVLDLKNSATMSRLNPKQAYNEIFETMRAKLYTEKHESASQANYATWSTSRLEGELEQNYTSLQHELLLSHEDQKQIEALAQWKHPAFENWA